MINLAKIEEQLKLKPFRPFWIETKTGMTILVTKPEWFFVVPHKAGEVVIFTERHAAMLNWRDLTDTIIVEQPEVE